jgi:hypothetical protein
MPLCTARAASQKRNLENLIYPKMFLFCYSMYYYQSLILHQQKMAS